jgi:hypothetical protein
MEGWKNHLFPQEKLKALIKEVSDERLRICSSCEHHSSNRKKKFHLRTDRHCTICGCPEKALTKCLSCNCSLEEINKPSLWVAVITPEEEEQFNIEEDEGEN